MNHIASGVKGLIISENLFLILVKYNGGFDLPGGRVEIGEGYKECLYREIMEEVGINVNILNPVALWTYLKEPEFLVNGMTFACQFLSGKVTLSKEHSGYLWAQLDTIPSIKIKPSYGLQQINQESISILQKNPRNICIKRTQKYLFSGGK